MTVKALLDTARSHLGYTESPPGSNRTRFAAIAGHPNGYAWCATFTVAVAKEAGVKIPAEVAATAYTPTAVNAWKKAGRWHVSPEPGDFAYFQFDGDPQVDHVGIVESVGKNGAVTCIEGNTSPSSVGSQANGGGVYRRSRALRLIVGYGRPEFTRNEMTDAEKMELVDMIASEVMKRLADDKVMAGSRLRRTTRVVGRLAEHFGLDPT